MIDLEELNKTWKRILRNKACKNDSQTMTFIRAIQHGKTVIRDVTPSELLAMDIEDAKKIAKIDELFNLISTAQEKAFGPILKAALKKD